ncbi:DNA mismatch repair endonuclease MutL [Gemella sp. GH3]|uniref:DNA mismatch repair endonuclease MutL n=1 Tax=unclassified Gemella TaxID=2624949 RepID=UPI0015CFE370|nr:MULTISPECIES: DNA mismatch repair endonuclease MutL [unclassified Gemella]MBF0714334.1 DNA mismatch repair endonuclease MutL [Gemella sp. GH3.1]NYS51286.1 DNA mismatch repair endonuclease MutL [Gemella sp. GH3]
MGKINILSHSLANKIAAGEVVERPASVVKELLENSIDAGSTNIKVVIKEFGIQEIRIIDNGSGISNDDIETAFMRHATSKIKNDYDLFHINTLGFRGEALASIASVSDIDIKSCSGEPQGKYLEIRGGEVTKNEYYAPIKGTDITVKNLFYNTPARLKYLKNPHTEQANIMNIINKLALSYSQISFEIIIDGKIVLKTYGDNDRQKLIAKVYNNDVAKNMLSFTGSNDDYKINGYISKPEETRASKNYINVFIKGRYVKNYAVQNAIIEGYGTFLMKNRYPIAIINIEMDSILLDVNVHPTKQEVRLSKEKELINLIKEVISTRLSNNTYIPNAVNNVSNKKIINQTEQVSFTDKIDETYVIKEPTNYSYNKSSNDYFEQERDNFFDFIKLDDNEDSFSFGEDENNNLDITNTNTNDDVTEESSIKQLPQLQVLAQIFKTYILCQTGDELYLIDQHAAQERYNYERLQKVFENRNNYKKQLLIPHSFNFSVDEAAEINNSMEKLSDLGLKLEHFGDNTYILREYPIWIEADEIDTIKEIVSKVLANKNITLKELRNDAIAMASCKASIKANQSLSLSEMTKLISDLYTCENPFTCPHGRPIITKMMKKDLEKMFKRIV